MAKAENAEALDTLRDAVLHLSHADLWSPDRSESLRTLSPYLSECSWEVDIALGRRRQLLSQEKALSWVREKKAIQAMFRKNDYDELSAKKAGVPGMLDEYDQLTTLLGGGLRCSEYPPDWQDSATAEETEAFWRLNELRTTLNKQGVDVDAREDTIAVLTNFDFALRTVLMTHYPLDSVDCPLLEPIASYLSKQQIQSSYLSRYFAMCLLNCLRSEANPDTRATKILTRLIGYFNNLEDPATCDGRELKEQLREVQRLDIGVPSLLFSLFQIILPGC